MKTQMRTLLKDFLAVLLGVVLTFAFAPYEIFPLAILVPATLLALWLDETPKKGFGLGYLFGLGFFGAGVNWVFISIHDIGGVPLFLSGLITSVFVAILSLFPACVGYLTNRYFPKTSTVKMVCAFPAIWVFSEWVRSWFFTGFPWLFLGYSQTNSPLKGFAALVGVYGVSLMVLITGGLLLTTYFKLKQKNYLAVYTSLFTIAFIWITGSLVNFIPWTKADKHSISIALVQGNIPQTIKWSPAHLTQSLDTYETLTEPLWGKVNLIFWPEAAVPLSLQNASEWIQKWRAKAKKSGSTLILGIPTETADGKNYYNAIVTLGDNEQVYAKRLLVPFGEYTPLANFFSGALRFMNLPMSDMTPGKFFQEPFVVNQIKIFPSICYEIAYPDLIRITDKSFGFLLTVTNDAWFGKSNAQAQHLQMAKMRAMEMGRPVVFVTNDGITAIIGPDGNIEAAAPTHREYVLQGNITPMFGLTPFMKHGSDVTLLILLGLLGYAIRLRKIEIPSETVTRAVE